LALLIAPVDVHARLNPDKLAVVDDRPDGPVTTWTFAELDRQAARLANVLRSLGIGPGEKFVWCGRNSAGIVRAIHARHKVGATSVPLNYRLTADEIAYVVDDSDAAVVYVDAEFAPIFAQIRPRLPRVREILVFDGPAPPGMLDGDALVAATSDVAPPPPPEAASHPSTMLYTSGTTGRPKGAVRGPTDPAQVLPLLEHVGHGPDDVYITTGPLYHSGPGGYLGIAHLLGNTAVVQRKFDPEDWLRLVDRYKVTSTFSAPTPMRMICQLPPEVKGRYDRRSMRVMIANAAPWSFALKEAYMADFGEDSLWEVYGSTELGVDTVLAPRDQRRKPGSCGRPAPGVEIALIDEAGHEITTPFVPGEVYVRAVGNFLTYYKAAEKYEAGRRGEYCTVGDIAYRDDEGYYYICDRKHDMVITGGMNVYPAEVEAVIDQHPAVKEVAVFGIPSEQWGEAVHAVVVARPDRPLGADEIIAFARDRLAGYKVPRSVSFAAELPHTGSGKLLKRELREPYWSGRSTRVV
jgi:fatty-acyl-CoA synthase/long-chain acyl-CoA synthetase